MKKSVLFVITVLVLTFMSQVAFGVEMWGINTPTTEEEVAMFASYGETPPADGEYTPGIAMPLGSVLSACIGYINNYHILQNVINMSEFDVTTRISNYPPVEGGAVALYGFPIQRIYMWASLYYVMTNPVEVGTGSYVDYNMWRTAKTFGHEFAHAIQWDRISYEESLELANGLDSLSPDAFYPYYGSLCSWPLFDEFGAEDIRILLGHPIGNYVREQNGRKDYRARMLLVEMMGNNYTQAQAHSRVTLWKLMPYKSPGDVNRDGVVNSTDANLLQSYFNANNNTEFIPANDINQLCNAILGDINLDWKADMTDVNLILAQ